MGNYQYGTTVLHDGSSVYLQEKPFSITPFTQTLQKIARQEGMKKSGETIDARTIAVKVKVVGTSRPDLEQRLSTMHQGLALRQQPLQIYALDSRYYVADATITNEVLLPGQPISVLMDITFVCQQPFAYGGLQTFSSPNPTTLVGSASPWTYTTTIIGGGNYFCRPAIRVYQRVTNIAWTQIQITQQLDNQVIFIPPTGNNAAIKVAGDYVDFFCDPTASNGYTIQKNSSGTLLDFTGQFPWQEPTSTTWQMSIAAPTKPQAQFIFSWTPRWLP